MSRPVRPGRPGARGGPRAGRVAGGTAPSPAREVAARVLERVEADLSFADSVLEAELTARRLEARDAALATEMVYGTLRWQRYLDWILAPHSRRRLESLDPRVRVLLRMTAYQIAFLERVPAFAAVNDAVTLAPLTPGVRAFVNAVLRSFARRGAREREPAPPRNPSDALAVRCSFPTWIVERWTKRYGREDAESLMRALNERPSLSLADIYCPPREPSFIGWASIVIGSPGFTVSAFQPWAATWPTEPISKAQSTVRPVVASTTATCSQQCGFVYSNSFSVPEMVIVFS